MRMKNEVLWMKNEVPCCKVFRSNTRRQRWRKILVCRRILLSLFFLLVLLIPFNSSYEESNEDDLSLNIMDDAVIDPLLNNNKNKYYGSNRKQEQHLIVISVDGSIYTLDANTGHTKGVFHTGEPLVGVSAGNNESNDDFDNRVIPGLDGQLYAIRRRPLVDDDGNEEQHNQDDDAPHLVPLSVSVMDVLAAPMRACSPTNPTNCGIVTGSKVTSVFAFDASTGLLQWTQQSSNEGGSSSNKKYYQNKNPPNQKDEESQEEAPNENVVLQREDFVVRHISTSTGDEVWNATVGHFNELLFEDAPPGGYNSNPYGHKDNKFPMTLPGASGNRFRPHQDPNHPPTISPTLEQEEEVTILPSIAFDDDGTTLTAFNLKTKTILWTKTWDNVIASVHGVGDDNWKELNVVDVQQLLLEESDYSNIKDGEINRNREKSLAPYFTSKQRKQHDEYIQMLLKHQYQGGANYVQDTRLLPNQQDDSKSNGLIIYKEPTAREIIQSNVKLKRLGEKVVFVAPNKNRQEIGFCNTHPLICGAQTKEQLQLDRFTPYIIGDDDEPIKLLSDKPDHHSSIFHEEQQQFDTSNNWNNSIYYTTLQQAQEGLFLTWTVVYVIVSLLISIAIGFRIYYVKQKRKWQESSNKSQPIDERNEDGLDEHKTNGHSFHTRDNNSIKKAGILSSMHNSTSPDNISRVEYNGESNMPKRPISRSVSLPQINGSADGSSRDPRTENPPPFKTPQASNIKKATTVTTAGTTSTGDTNSVLSSLARVGSIDGVPMVRYARYKSEFNELSPLGKGGFGTVFRCSNALDGREYAVKKVWINSKTDCTGNLTKEFSQRLQRVLREVKILALLDHPNVVRYYTAWLELEKDNENLDTTAGLDSYTGTTTTDRKKSTMHFSSDLLAGGGETTTNLVSTASERKNYGLSVAGRVKNSNEKRQQVQNPLGWNTFQMDGNLFESPPRRRKVLKSLEDDDFGITFERSTSDASDDNFLSGRISLNSLPAIQDNDRSDDGSWADSSSDSDSSSSSEEEELEESVTQQPLNENTENAETDKGTSLTEIVLGDDVNGGTDCKQHSYLSTVRHTLYIQMQLCSQKTLADFLANSEARTRSNSSFSANKSWVDIPYALSLFRQIAQGVKHVHEQGLIHRDLKPQNCFIDDSGVVKVGDFGLSRGSSTATEPEREGIDDLDTSTHRRATPTQDDNTAGVGTRMYASPEQIMGSDYDATTDVYSLGIILFELCYPMYTGMERHIVFEGLRKHKFPQPWYDNVASTFPTLHSLLNSMLSSKQSERPSADAVSQHIKSLLSEYTVLSLDRNRHQMRGSTLLRVEGKPEEGVLARTIKLIKEVAPGIEIVQYGMRSQEDKTIMEFALSTEDKLEKDDSCSNDDGSCSVRRRTRSASLGSVMEKMRQSSSINLVREVSDVQH